MQYHKDQIGFATAMEYLRASLAVQAAHQWLIRYCAERETGGHIVASGTWTDKDWLVATHSQLKLRDVRAVVAAGLAKWLNGTLVVHGYDLTGQEHCLRERDRLKRIRNGDQTQSRTRTELGAVRDPVQTSPDQTNPEGGGAPPRDPAASPLDSSIDPETDMPSPLRAHGCEIDHADPDKQAKLRREWREACKAMTDQDIEAVFQHCKDPIRFAREFVTARKAWVLATGWTPVDRDEVERRKRAADEHFAALERQRAADQAQQAKAKASPVNDRARAQRLLDFMADDTQDWDEILDAPTKERLAKLRAALTEDRPVGLIMVTLNLPAPLLAAMDPPAGGQGAA